MIFPKAFFDRARCASVEKFEAVPLASAIVRLALKARRCGLLSLEEDAAVIESDLLRIGLVQIVDGVDPSRVEELLMTRIQVQNISGVRLLCSMIVMDGLLAIQQGEEPWLIRLRIMNYFGEDAAMHDSDVAAVRTDEIYPRRR